MNSNKIVKFSNTISILGILSIIYMHFFVPIPSTEINKCIYSACAKIKAPKLEYKKSLEVRKHIPIDNTPKDVAPKLAESKSNSTEINIPKIKRLYSFSFNETKRLERFNSTDKIKSITYTGGKSLSVRHS